MANLRNTIDRIKDSTRKCKPDGHGGYTACCPAHEDREPSLSFARKGDRVVFRCHAGCSQQAVLDRLGLDWPDLFEDGGSFAKKARPERPLPGPIVRPKRPERPEVDWQCLHALLLTLPSRSGKLVELASVLGVPVEALESAGYVWVPRWEGMDDWLKCDASRTWVDCWASPERGADGKVCGLTRRYADGSKKQMAGGTRGLVYDPSQFPGAAGPVLVVEGASDVCAGLAAGLNVVGRPSNTGGAHLASLLLAMLPVGTPIVVLGENDQKPNGRWPGKEGAEKVAQELADALPGRDVYVAYPPDGAKDLRAWQAGRCGEDAGQEFLARLEKTQVISAARVAQAARSHNALETIQAQEHCATDQRPWAGDEAIAALTAGLKAPPPNCACPNPHVLHCKSKTKHAGKSFCRACGGWGCSVCCRRNSHRWAVHLANCFLCARDEQYRFAILTRSVHAWDDRETRDMREQHIRWVSLQTSASTLLVVLAVPHGTDFPPGATPLSLEELGERLVEWANARKDWPLPFSRAKARYVRTCDSWKIVEEKAPSDWQVITAGPARRLETVEAVLRTAGLRFASDESAPNFDPWRVWSVVYSLDSAPPDLFTKLALADDNVPDVPWRNSA